MGMLLGIHFGTIVEFARVKLLLPPNPDGWGATGMMVKATRAADY